MKYSNEIKIGIFVIGGLVLLIFGWAFLREFAVQVQPDFKIVYDDVSGLTKGSFVRINGLRVGRVDNLILDTKQNKVLVEARIQVPDIKIPKDSKFYIRTSGFVGDKYLDVEFGMSNQYIKDNEVILGEPVVDSFRSLEKISKILNEIQPEVVGKNIQDVTSGAASFIKKADSVVGSADRLVMGLPTGEQFTALVEKAHDTVAQLNNAVERTQILVNDEDAQNNLSKLLQQANVVSADIRNALKDANSLANNKNAYNNINSLLIRASKIVEQIDELRADPLIQNEFRETLNNANAAAKKLAETSDNVSMALSKRFLLPRLFLGMLIPSKHNNDNIQDKTND